MAKYQFNACQRFAIWRTYGETCFWCGKPLAFNEMTIDHFIAESLAEDPKQFVEMLKYLGLPTNFDVNSFRNWVSACSTCNGKKGQITFTPTPFVAALLDRVEEWGKKCEQLAASCLTERSKGLLLSRLAKATETGEVSENEFREVGATLFAKYAPVVNFLRDRTAGLHIAGDWYIVNKSSNGRALVAGKNGIGLTAYGPDPDSALKCESCGEYGPWRGINCINCGNSQTPDHGE